MNDIILYIPGEPATITAQQKGSAIRGNRIIHYVKNAVAREDRRIRRFAKLQAPAVPIEGCVAVHITMVFPLTQAQAKKYAHRLSDSSFVIRKPTKPDWDNSPKLICDALTKEKFWGDDSQITDGTCCKRYGSEPRIEIVIISVPQEIEDLLIRNANGHVA